MTVLVEAVRVSLPNVVLAKARTHYPKEWFGEDS